MALPTGSPCAMPERPARRRFLLATCATAPGLIGTSATHGRPPPPEPPRAPTPSSLRTEDLPRHFDVEPGVHNLENGYWGVMPREVAAAYASNVLQVNRTN